MKKKSDRKAKAKESKKQQQVLSEKMKRPLHGNIAASFLFNKEKTQLGDIIQMKANEGSGETKDGENSSDSEDN